MVKYAVMDNEGADKWLGHEEVMLSLVYCHFLGASDCTLKAWRNEYHPCRYRCDDLPSLVLYGKFTG